MLQRHQIIPVHVTANTVIIDKIKKNVIIKKIRDTVTARVVVIYQFAEGMKYFLEVSGNLQC